MRGAVAYRLVAGKASKTFGAAIAEKDADGNCLLGAMAGLLCVRVAVLVCRASRSRRS